MLPNLVCLEHHPKVRIAPGPDRSGLFCAQARSMRCVHTPVQRDQRRTTRPCDNPARTARSNLHLNRLSLRDFARAKRKLVSYAVKRSGQRTRMAATTPSRSFVVISLLLIVICGGPSRKAAQNGPRRGSPIVFSLLLTMAGHWTAPLR